MVEPKEVPREKRCKAEVWKRDCYRRTGRGPTGFSMHYNESQCGRPRKGEQFCWQHEREAARGRNVRICRWA